MRSVFALLMMTLAACATAGPAGHDTSRAVPADTARAAVPIPRRQDRVRVVYPATSTQPERYRVGILHRLSGDTVVLAGGGAAETIVLSPGMTLQAVVRSRGHAWNGLGLGMLVGGLLGAAVGSQVDAPCSGWMDFTCGPQTELGAAAGVLFGGMIGAVAGAGVRTVEWGTVPLAGAHASIGPTGLLVRVAL